MNKAQAVEKHIMFKPSSKPLYAENDYDLWFLFQENKIMLLKEYEHYIVPRNKDIDNMNIDMDNIQCMGGFQGHNCHCGEIIQKIQGENIEFLDLMTFSKETEKNIYTLATKGNLFVKWMKLNKHCGKCGSKMYLKDSYTERALVCSNCGNTTWPRTSPAIIVAITKGDKLLLAHNKRFSEGKYSVLAGFVEYGETFEECVRREVYEEVGIEIKNIKYFGSQPWPFPNSMMVGFTAEYLDGEIEEDGEEIVHADWFSKEEIPQKYTKSISIGSQLIEWFMKNH